MYFRGKKLTLENISIVLEEYSRDIRDEVRSMLMDGIDLTDWIETCRDNPFRLKQIRMAALEGLAPSFFELQDGEIIYKLREVIRAGFSGDELLPYVGLGFDKEQWSYILNWYQRGFLDSRLQLNRTPKSMWHFLDDGMRQGLPMHIFTTSPTKVFFSGEEMRSILQIMNNSAYYQKYLNQDWNENTLSAIAEMSSEYWFKFYDNYIHNFISLPVLEGISLLAEYNFISGDFLESLDGRYLYANNLSEINEVFLENELYKFDNPQQLIEQWKHQ